MFDLYFVIMFLAFQVTEQPNAGGGQSGEPAAEGGMSMFTIMLMFLALFFLLMMITSKPGQKDQQRVKALIDSLKKNDKVVTAGGIVGTVVNVNSDSDFLTIRIDESNNTKMQVLKQSIIRVLNDSSASGDDAKKS